MNKYEVLVEFSTGPDEAKVTNEVGAIIELDAETAAPLLQSGNIKIADSEITQAKVGDVCDVDGKPGTLQEVEGVLTCVVTPVEEQKVEETAAVDPNAEPRKRHISGKLVLFDGKRVVSEREFHHVKFDDGSEMDLTDKEYEEQIKLSYPPTK